jgi:plasmid stabilization system protein ParE
MAEIVWTEPAYFDLDDIAGYIAVENPEAAARLSQRILKHVRQLEKHPLSGSLPFELEGTTVRQIVEPPVRIFYRFDGKNVYILHLLRFERILRLSRLDEPE